MSARYVPARAPTYLLPRVLRGAVALLPACPGRGSRRPRGADLVPAASAAGRGPWLFVRVRGGCRSCAASAGRRTRQRWELCVRDVPGSRLGLCARQAALPALSPERHPAPLPETGSLGCLLIPRGVSSAGLTAAAVTQGLLGRGAGRKVLIPSVLSLVCGTDGRKH